MKGKSMKLNELLSVAEQGYPDPGACLNAASENDYCDDTLALFVVRELKDTFDHNAPVEAQLNEAIRAMRVARDDLDGVIEALRDKLCKVKVEDVLISLQGVEDRLLDLNRMLRKSQLEG